MVVTVNLLVMVLFFQGNLNAYREHPATTEWSIPGTITALTLLAVGLGALLRMRALASGGKGVASLLGARPITRGTLHESERRLINVVDEMAIASGITPPEVYLLEEPSINAMAAGLEPSSAAIIMHQGTLDALNRDELQAVVAHEFSHIFNGDMRLNLRLIGAIAGILSLVTIGRMTLRGRDKKSASFWLLGIGFIAIGSLGALFAKIIQAAVSRQREYLADATAVQYTRNPHAMVSCLRKIGAQAAEIEVSAPAAPEVSHMFFSSILAGSWFQTHPPLKDRIRAIDGSSPVSDSPSKGLPRSLAKPTASSAGFAAPLMSVGNPTASHLSQAHSIQNRFTQQIQQASHSHTEAEALLHAVVAGGRHLEQVPEDLRTRAASLARDVEQLGESARFPLISLALATLRELNESSRLQVIDRLRRLIESDGHYSLFEVAVLTVVERTLLRERVSLLRGGRATKPATIEGASGHLTTLLWAVATAGAGAPQSRQMRIQAYTRAATSLFGSAKPFVENIGKDHRALRNALTALDGLDFRSKAKVLRACWECAETDGTITLAETEMLRAVHCALDCPMPPSLLA